MGMNHPTLTITMLVLIIAQTYKPPSSKDIPIDFRIEFLKNAPNPVGVLGSKGTMAFHCWLLLLSTIFVSKLAVGEPPLCMSCSALFALKRAIEEARKDAGNADYFPLCKTLL